MRGALAVLAWAVVGVSGGAWAAPSLEFVSQLGGTCAAVAAEGEFVYFAEGPRLVIVDASDPASPVEVGRSAPLESAIQAVAVADGYAYVALDLYGLAILSLADLTHPAVVGRLVSRDAILGVCVEGDRALVAERYQGVSVVSLADRTQPQRTGTLVLPGRATGVALVGDIAYVAAGDQGLRLVSLVDPTAPVELGACTTLASAFAVAVDGDMAYVADEVRGLVAVSVADPARPEEVGAVELPQAVSVAIKGTLAYVVDRVEGLQLVSVADPAAPVVVDTLRFDDGARALALSGELAFVAAWSSGLRIVLSAADVALTEIAAVDSASYGFAVLAAEDVVYLLDSARGVRVISVEDPAAPRQLAVFPADGALCLDRSGTHLFLGIGTALVVVDVTDPSAPTDVARLELPGRVRDLKVAGEVVVAAIDSAGLAVVSVSDPTAPKLVGSLALPGYAYGVDVFESVAYVAAWTSGLRIVAIDDPAHPAEIGSLATEGAARSVVAGPFVYVCEQSAVTVVSVDDPTRPTEVGAFHAGLRTSVHVVDDLAVLAFDWRGVSLVSFADRANPDEIALLDTADRANDVSVVGDLAYVADQAGGLYVFRIVGEDGS
jgi:hypothetical protein